MIHFLVCSLIIIDFVCGARPINCTSGQIHFEKIVGLNPKKLVPLVLYQGPHHHPITLQCLEKCANIEECVGFVLKYKISSCFWYRDEVESYDEFDNIVDENVAWFIKICLNVGNCTKKWAFERSPGATLIGNDIKKLPHVVTRRECQQSCLNERSFNCRSAKFTIGHKSGSEVFGKCTLSDTDRHLMPNSFRVSKSDEEYFDNQCSKAIDEKFCPFEEYDNISLSHVDQLYENKTKEDCEILCQNSKEFNCRGYSIWPLSNSINSKYVCLIHSEDSKLLGPKLLMDRAGAIHYEQAPCLNITVTCSNTDMIVQYAPRVSFFGKIYMKGFSENPGCHINGKGLQLLKLQISLKVNQCGISKAMSNTNSTLYHSTMILQYNNIVQTQADRVIRVGCIYGNLSNVVVGTGVNFTTDLPNNGITAVNSTNNPPNVAMRVVDFYTQEEVSETQIGQELELIIEVNSQNETFDISAGHLIAMTPNADDSILLLDDRGCPTNLNVFPALTKLSSGPVKRLVAAFQAFKFSSSSIIRFSVMVMFCDMECPTVDCGNYVNSRRRRDILENGINDTKTDGSKVKKVAKYNFDKFGREIIREMPLELLLKVRNPKDITSDKLIFGESNRYLIADYDYDTQKVCVDYTLFIAFIILWVFILLVLVGSSFFIVRKYKRYYENLCIRQSMEELNKNFGLGYSNLENRRVHFASSTE